MTPKNLFAPFPSPAGPGAGPAEILDTLAEAAPKGSLRIERIQSPPGHASPPGFWYDQPGAEWVLLLEGAATLRFRNPDATETTTELRPGDYLEIPPHHRHRIDSTHPAAPTRWLAIHWS